MALTKIVDGRRVAVSPSEETVITQEWTDNALPPTTQEQQTIVQGELNQITQSRLYYAAMFSMVVDMINDTASGTFTLADRATIATAAENYTKARIEQLKGFS